MRISLPVREAAEDEIERADEIVNGALKAVYARSLTL